MSGGAMVRVLHYTDPEQARRRIAFLGAAEEDADRLIEGLRAFLISVSLEDESARVLPAVLRAKGIFCARGRDVLLFSVSSNRQLETEDNGVLGRDYVLDAVRGAVDRYRTRDFIVRCRDRELSLSGTPKIMGVLNVTPDSFSDGGKYLPMDRAVERGREMAEAGADIVDVGGESTRPGSDPVPPEVERERVIPVIRALAATTDAVLSIDTTKADVAREAVASGAHIVNDTSALEGDPDMAGVVRDSGCAVVLMHRRGTPRTMQVSPSYVSFFDEMLDELAARVSFAKAAGIPEDRILVDPGIGFGKRLADNLALHRHLPDLRNLGLPVVFGSSRKSFLGGVTGKGPADRLLGTAASMTAAVLGGAHVLRVHDVEQMTDVIRVASALTGGVEC